MDREQKLYYFDNNATTRVAPEVVEAMLPFLTDLWGNASSAYRFGHRIRQYVDQAREKVAAAGINIAFLMAQVIGRKFAAVIGFETDDDAKKAAPLIKKATKGTKV